MVTDHRKLPRRRGDALNDAIYRATLDELAEVGYAKLTMERVAERAKASKASLYRRWPTKMELVHDAVQHVLRGPMTPPDTGSLRDDLISLLRQSAEMLTGPAGEALRGVLTDALSDARRTAELRARSHGSGLRMVETIVRRAAARGEIDESAITPRRLEVPLALLRHHFLFHGVPVPGDVIGQMVDEILVPLFKS
ncbi:TetR/AcrR family transcriptional regulator [Allorhizocola rhizosphaerae]|uniref:TetR/AcrR family transcriptional regulator n=1 Tax=Allorhizocola rhizosphaerae TaxID=1872709 RepID=UPI000E3DB381|nr:TetR/AcrR family transcriptional regulator [Allorhizocola rhizosphaerae]